MYVTASVLKEKLSSLGSSGILADHQLQAQLQEHHLKGLVQLPPLNLILNFLNCKQFSFRGYRLVLYVGIKVNGSSVE